MCTRLAKTSAQGLQRCCTGPANIMHQACQYVAQGLQRCCTSFANVYRACNYAGHSLHCSKWASTKPGTVLRRTVTHRVCRYTPPGLQICCTVPANMLHAALKYVAQCMQTCCTGPRNMLHKYVAQGLQICCPGPANMMHRAYKYAAQGLQL